MKRSLFLTLSVALCLVASGARARAQGNEELGPPPPPPEGQFFFGHERFLFAGLNPVAGAPFSAQATTETTQTLADGNQIKRTQTVMLYRDSAGRTRREETISSIGPWSAAKGPHQMVNVTDPVAGVSYMLDPKTKTAVKLPTAKLGRRHAQTTAKVRFTGDVTSLGTQQMAGLAVDGTRTTETIPAGAMGNEKPLVMTSERWYSPDLQITVYSKHTDPRFGTTIYQVTNISRQEPDASLFQVPSDYTMKERPGLGRGAAAVSP